MYKNINIKSKWTIHFLYTYFWSNFLIEYLNLPGNTSHYGSIKQVTKGISCCLEMKFKSIASESYTKINTKKAIRPYVTGIPPL